MTAPLTPSYEPHHPPSQDAGPVRIRRELLRGVLTAVAVGVCGVVLGLLWLWLAPRVPVFFDGSNVYLKDSEGEQAVGADGWFTLLGLGMGALTALGVFLWRRTGGVAVVIGLAVGGVLGSLLAWRMGVSFGPPKISLAHARAVGVNKTFYAPLELRAKGALLAWPAASMAVFLALTSAFAPNDPQPVPHWEEWGAPQGPQPHDPGAPVGPQDPSPQDPSPQGPGTPQGPTRH
ncbi:DUF2567 domain-containing protein [Streptantibioticus parmotrematis]|uniref:DUF2567 domain-containing protein n=1 Tax=Streptantibioticus parmotrematis TaxID=2873249 RepID=UPI0027E1E06D|nr:DUF2567 domain-containing protein [Streptantibioticus parmotrematis]